MLDVTLEVVEPGRRSLRRVTLVVDGSGPLVDPRRTLGVEDRRGTNSIGPEDYGHRRVTRLGRQVLHGRLEVARELGQADELALGVVGADPERVHRLLRLSRLRRQALEHRLERRAGVRPDHARRRERREARRGLLDRETGLIRDEPGLLERHAQVRDATHRLASTRSQEVRDVSHVRATEPELLERDRRDPRRLSDTDATRSRQVEGTTETAAEDVGSRDARLPKLLDRVRSLGRREHGPLASVDRRDPQQVDGVARVLTCGRHVAHGLVEVGELLDRDGRRADHRDTERTDARGEGADVLLVAADRVEALGAEVPRGLAGRLEPGNETRDVGLEDDAYAAISHRFTPPTGHRCGSMGG